MVTHILLIEEAAVHQSTRDQLNKLLDRAIDHLRLTAPEVQVRITPRGVTVEQVEH